MRPCLDRRFGSSIKPKSSVSIPEDIINYTQWVTQTKATTNPPKEQEGVGGGQAEQEERIAEDGYDHCIHI